MGGHAAEPQGPALLEAAPPPSMELAKLDARRWACGLWQCSQATWSAALKETSASNSCPHLLQLYSYKGM